MFAQVALVIPAYRPSAVLLDLVDAIYCEDRERVICGTVIVDDGSGPEFRAVFDSVLRRANVTVLRHAVNLGKGAALKTGLNYALVAFPCAAGGVTADADGQHAAADIVRLAHILSENPEQITLGVREFDTQAPLRSRLGNVLTRGVFRVFTGMRLTDTQTGLRAWPRWHCEAALVIPINGYDFELECLLKAHEAGSHRAVAIRQEPIETIYLDGNRSSHFDPIRDSMRIYFVFLRYCGVAILSALVDSLTFYLVVSRTGNLIAGQIAGRVLSVALAFVLARNVVFRSNVSVAVSFAKYLTFVALMGAISYGTIDYLHARFGIPPVFAKLIAEGFLFPANFSIQRQIVFARSRQVKPAA